MEDINVVRISGIDMPVAVPLAPFISNRANAGTNADELRSAVHILVKKLQHPRSVLVIDDADKLDETSIQTILLVRHQTRVPILIATWSHNSGGTQHLPLSAYLTPILCAPMRSMRYDHVDRILRDQLQLTLEPSSLGLITSICGGLPGLALSITETLQRCNALSRSGTAWRVQDCLWKSEFTALAQQYLFPLSEKEVLALHTLAVARVMTIEQAKSSSLWEQIRSLEQLGLIHVLEVRGEQEIAVYPPLLIDYFEHEGGSLTRYEICQNLSRTEQKSLRPTRKDADRVTGSQTALLSYRTRSFWENEVTGRRTAWLADPSPWTALRYLIALSHVSADTAEHDRVIVFTPEEGPAMALVLFWSWWACHVAIMQNMPEEGISLVRRGRLKHPAFDGALRAIEAYIILNTGGIPDSYLLDSPALNEHALSEELLGAVRVELFIAQGLLQQAFQQLDATIDGETGIQTSKKVARGMIMFLDGNIGGAAEWALEHYEVSRIEFDFSWAEGHAYVAALSLAMAGRLDALDTHLATLAPTASTKNINTRFLASTFAFASMVASERGQVNASITYAKQALSFGFSDEVCMQFPAHLAHLIATQTGEGISRAAWEATEQRIAAGHITSAVQVGMIALEYDADPAHAQRISDLAQNTESPLLNSLATYAEALIEPSAENLSRVRIKLADAGLILPAVRAGVRAVRMHRAGGDHERALLEAEALWGSLCLDDAGLAHMLFPLVQEIGLTDRELEIVSMLADRSTSQQIADALVLSVRTVEQHVLRACRKVGVSRRGDLADAAGTWLSPFLRPRF
ncbi:LuxR C-terminal-related transcriptional regulator [Lysinibacter sp. HNR]|uniref:response regulator transcription factor n=1 Tax=Lysinibacter sp. HNR TaxID=3031408 RepID=UPI0024348FC0|nr:LuxR C-terminal-related transcriptional regulator [Lysinibacter sp. HNR]WGD36448.1 LuxR C-terminal-related transcriptional regulator [Lysinibacter sp. HNR]